MGRVLELPARYASSLVQGMMRAILLDRRFYREVGSNQKATLPAFLVITVVAVATGIGSMDDGAFLGLSGLPVGIVLGAIGWLVWTAITYVLGVKLFRAQADERSWGTLARAIGFAQAPGVLRALGVFPGLGLLISVVALVWLFVAMVVAVRENLNFESLWKPAFVILVGFVPYVFIVGGINLLLART